MNLKIFDYIIFLSTAVASCSSPATYINQASVKSETAIKEKLGHPFGTLLKLKVEIFDGDLTDSKGYEGAYLLKIKNIDKSAIADTLLMTFKDETGKLPANNFQLYKYLFGKNIGSISSDQIEKMKKEYVGKEYNIVAYETGEFTGIPNGYFKYQEVRQDMDFHFNNYLVVVADSVPSEPFD